MNKKVMVHTSLLASFIVSIGAFAAQTPELSPEMQAAGERVSQAKAQLGLAIKQLSASKALVKAAQADLKASQASFKALKLQAHAQGLVNETGMTPAKAIAAQPNQETQSAPPPTGATLQLH